MALPACFHLADDVFPRVRAEAARRMVADGQSQSATARRLGVSQAMVSKYTTKPREDDALVLRLVEELLAEPDDQAEGASAWCGLLAARDARPGLDEGLADMLEAERRLLREAPLHVVPEVGLNIARALPDATDASGVLAYPARIVAAGDRLVRPVPPELGASNHLAACLFALREHDAGLQAIANIRGGDVMRAAAQTAIDLVGEGDRVVLFRAAVAAAPEAPRLIHDTGAVGIEPCLYVAGRDAAAVVDTILSIASKVNP